MQGTHTHTHKKCPHHVHSHPPTCARTHIRNTCCICDPFLCWTGNGNFCKSKSAGLKIQRINVHHMWHSGRMEDILTAGGGEELGGEEQSWGFSNSRERETHTHTHTHTLLHWDETAQTPKSPPALPWAFSTNTTLESCWKLCPSRSILSPPGAGHVSRLCLSTSGSSWADLWAVGGKKQTGPHRSANTHPLPMQTWASRPRLNHYLDSFHRAVNLNFSMLKLRSLFGSKHREASCCVYLCFP